VELWKDVVGFEGLYEVSDQGRVKRVEGSAAGCIKTAKPDRNRGGYLKVNLCRNGKGTYHRVHRLVAAAFLGPCPADHEVGHKDHDPTNNRVENLEYVTHRENVYHSIRAGRHYLPFSSNLTAADVLEIRATEGVSLRKLAAKYGVGFNTIGRIRRREVWTHV
jgi:hypothetical protein